jgi:sugar lactone lactonase YvrE
VRVDEKNNEVLPGWVKPRTTVAATVARLVIGYLCAALAIFFVPSALLAQKNVIMTVAGQGAAGVTLSLPTGVAADAAGNFYVADTNNCVIWKINSNGVSSKFAGTQGNCSAGSGANPTLAYPVDVASCNGNVYFATHGVDPTLPGFTGATVAGGSIYMINSSGVLSTLLTPTLPAMAISPPFPVALACDAKGNVFVSSYFYISEGFGGSVDEIPFESSTTQNLIAQFDDAFPGIAVDSNDNIFALEAASAAGWLGVASLGAGNLWQLTGNGGSTAIGTNGHLQNPARLRLDASGNFYITQAAAVSSPTVIVATVPKGGGIQTTFAGNGTAGYSGQGVIPTQAELNNATGMAFDGCGSLYIADAGNNAVRKVFNSATASNAGCTSGSSGTGSGVTTQISLTSSAPQVTAPQTISFYANVAVSNCPTCTNPLQGEVFFCYAVAPSSNPCGSEGVAFGAVLLNGPGSTTALANLLNYSFPIPGTYSVAAMYLDSLSDPNGVLPSSTSAPLTVTICGASCTDPGIPNIPQSTYPVALTPGVLSSVFSGLGAVAFDANGNRYFLNSTSGTVTRLDTAGGSTQIAAGLANPSDMVLGSDGNLYITDTGTNAIVKVVGPSTASPTVSLITLALSPGLNSPTGIFETGSEVYVTDTGNNRVVAFRPDGTFPSVIFSSATTGAPAIGSLRGIVVNPTSLKIYIANAPLSGSSSPGNIIVTSIGGSASLLSTPGATLEAPFGLALDPANGLYFSDTGTHQIYRMDVHGNILVVAGNGATTPIGEGVSATQTGLSSPMWLALDLSNSIWFADAGTSPPSVRQVDVTQALVDFTAANQSQTIYLTSPVSGVQGSVGVELPPSPYLTGSGSADYLVQPASTCVTDIFNGFINLSPNTSCALDVTLNTFSSTATATIDFLSEIEESLGSFNPSSALTQTIRLNVVVPAPLQITPSMVFAGTVGSAYGPVLIQGTGGSGQVTFTESGTLPAGISFTSTGSLSGTPTQVGTFPFTVRANDTNGDSTSQPYSLTINPAISVTPAVVSVVEGSTQQFTATVIGTTNTAVSWSVQAGGAGGTISTTTGLYTAPATTGIDTVIATSAAFPGAIATATVTVTAPQITVSIAPLNPTVPTKGTQQFMATVTGTTNSNVIWSFQPAAVGGMISTSGLFTAPATVGLYTVTATTVAIPAAEASTTVTVIPATPPPPASIALAERISVTDTPTNPYMESITVSDKVTIFPLINIAEPAVFLSPASLGFGSASGTQSLTLSNTGDAPLTLASDLLSGSAFAITSILCSTGATSLPPTLPSGGFCTFGLTYTAPAGSGTPPTGTLTFTDSAGLSNAIQETQLSTTRFTQVVPLNGDAGNTFDPPPSARVNIGTVPETINVIDAPVVSNTDVGVNVLVRPVDTTTGTAPVTLTFANVVQPGITSLTTSSTGPAAPAGFQPGAPSVYYNLSTTAVYTGSVTICINYAGITFTQLPQLFHYQNGAWTNVTTSVNTASMIACGTTTSFSPFALFQPSAFPTTTAISANSVTYGTPASVTVSVSSSSGTVTGSVSLIVDGGSPSSMTLSNGSAVFNLGVLNAATHSLSASFAAQGNFLASSAVGTLAVGQVPLTIAANNATRVYGGTNPALTASYAGFVNGDTPSVLIGILSCSTTATSASPVGTYPIICSGQTAANYSITHLPGQLTVSPVLLTITANNLTKNFNAPNPKLTWTASGFVNGDTTSVLTTLPTCTTTATTTSPVGSYPITCSGATSANYILTYVPGTLTVTGGAPTLVSIAVSPSTDSLPVGAAQNYTASGTYSDTSVKNLTSQVTWSSTNTAAATISSAGYAFVVGTGSTTITASLSGVNGTANLTTFAPSYNVVSVPTSITTDANGNYIVQLSVTNDGTVTLSSVTFTSVKLISTAASSLPAGLTNLAPGSTVVLTLSFPSSAGAAGTRGVLQVQGNYVGAIPGGAGQPGAFNSSSRVTLP